MKINEYQELAMKTASTVDEMRVPPKDLLNGIMGVMGEAGEVDDHIKKYMFQGHDLDVDKLKKELGDICWYVAMFARGLNMSLEDIMIMNIEKLKIRYPEGYFSVDRSVNRTDHD